MSFTFIRPELHTYTHNPNQTRNYTYRVFSVGLQLTQCPEKLTPVAEFIAQVDGQRYMKVLDSTDTAEITAMSLGMVFLSSK